jgi:hypothetical protein
MSTMGANRRHTSAIAQSSPLPRALAKSASVASSRFGPTTKDSAAREGPAMETRFRGRCAVSETVEIGSGFSSRSAPPPTSAAVEAAPYWSMFFCAISQSESVQSAQSEP